MLNKYGFTRPMSCLAAGALLALAAPAAAQERGTTRTSGQITVYGWLAGYGGDIRPGTGAPTVSVSKGFGELFEDLDGAFFASGLIRRDNLVLLTDISHTSSSKEGLVPTGVPALPFVPAEGRLKQTAWTVVGGFRVSDQNDVSLDLLGGVRAWWVRPRVNVPALGVRRGADVEFVDPIIGARLNAPLSRNLSAIVYADIGGFGAGSDLTGQVVGTVNARVGRNIWLSGGYRYLGVDYKSGGVRVNSRLGGPLIGATFTF